MTYNLNTPFPSYNIFLNSKNCDVKKDNRYKFNMNTKIRTPLNTKFLLSVEDVIIPNVYDNILTYNNKISFLYGEDKFTHTLPTGRYNAYQFKDNMNSFFSAINKDITCIYNKITFKLSFVSQTEINIINETLYPTTIGDVIGAYIFPIVWTAPIYTIDLDVVNFSGTKYIFINAENLTINNLNSFGNIDSNLVRDPVNCNFGEVISYKPPNPTKYLINKKTFDSFVLTLEDDRNNPLLLNQDFQIQIRIDVIYPEDLRDLEEGTIAHMLKTIAAKEENKEDDDKPLGN